MIAMPMIRAHLKQTVHLEGLHSIRGKSAGNRKGFLKRMGLTKYKRNEMVT